MKRESFGSRLGFILVSAGCAIGIGNVWRFPYVAGENGGSVFVLFYLLFLLCMGVPVLTMELAVGRASRKSAVNGYKALEKPGSKWHIHGWLCMLGCYLLMMYYTTVSGWMISYFFKFLTGTFHGLDTEAVSGVFGSLLADPMEMGLWMACYRHRGLSDLQPGSQKRPGADHQMDDGLPLRPDPGAGRPQHAAARGKGGPGLLPAPRF